MSTHSTFEALDFFALRTPLLPVEVFQEMLTGTREQLLERLTTLAQSPLIREAIAVSSLSLLDSLDNLAPDNPLRKREQAAKGLLRYLLRMTTRPTPFGLFSGVTYGTYGESQQFHLQEATAHKKRTRPDMEWLLQVLAMFESDPDTVRQLHVTTNSLAYEIGSRVHLPYLTRYGQMVRSGATSLMERTSVRSTPAVKLAFDLAKAPIPYEELINHLLEAYPGTSHEQINQFVWQLFEQEFLISDLRPPLVDVSPFDYVLNRLRTVNGQEELKGQLQEINERMKEYDRLPIGQGEDQYRQLIELMRAVQDGKNLIQVDLAVQTDGLQLPFGVKEEIERTAEVLWRMSNDVHGMPHLNQYRSDFIEKYGRAREVPLLELLDEDIGLGAPATYEYPRSRRQDERQVFPTYERRHHLLSQWLMPLLLQGGSELELTDEMVAELAGGQADAQYAPRSFELYFGLAARSPEAMMEGDYRLVAGGSSGSFGAGKSIGRFVDMMDSELQQHLQNVDQREQEVAPGAVFAEVVYLPGAGRAANVVLSSNPREYEIVIGTMSSKEPERTIPLSDLVVGLGRTGFYLRSRMLGQEVIPVTGHMLNTNHTPNVYRFLRELSQERQRIIETFTWGELESLPYLPRVRYRRTVLATARWKLNAHVKLFREGMNEEEWSEAFKTFCEEWRVPRYVYLTQTDNRLLLDLWQEAHVDEVRRDFFKLMRGQSLTLTEAGMDWDEHPQSGHGRYVTEFVFPLVKSAAAPKREPVQAKPQVALSNSERLKLPGSEWLFVKWYGVQDRSAEFLGGPLREFCRRAEQEQWVGASFFMRYADPEPHIRLRFVGEPMKLWTQLLPQLHGFAKHCQQEGMLSRMVIDTYDPEIERYGGPELMRMAEQWFCMDSRVVAHWISLLEQGQLSISKDTLAVISIVDIMEQFGYSFEEQLADLNKLVHFKEYQDLFRPQRKTFTQLADARDGFAGLANHPAGAQILPTLQGRSGILRQYAGMVSADERFDVMQSVIHLHLNRLYGIEREDEKRVLTLTRHTLYSLGPIRRARA